MAAHRLCDQPFVRRGRILRGKIFCSLQQQRPRGRVFEGKTYGFRKGVDVGHGHQTANPPALQNCRRTRRAVCADTRATAGESFDQDGRQAFHSRRGREERRARHEVVGVVHLSRHRTPVLYVQPANEGGQVFSLGNYIHYSFPRHYYFLTTGIYSLKINPFIGNTLGAPLVGQ